MKRKIISFLETLPHSRFNINTLNKELSKFFKQNITVEEVEYPDGPDFNLLFEFELEDINGFVDIYILKHKNEGFDGATFYITEVGYEFD